MPRRVKEEETCLAGLGIPWGNMPRRVGKGETYIG